MIENIYCQHCGKLKSGIASGDPQFVFCYCKYFHESDLISFGNYLLSEMRKLKTKQTVDEHDLEMWISLNKPTITTLN